MPCKCGGTCDKCSITENAVQMFLAARHPTIAQRLAQEEATNNALTVNEKFYSNTPGAQTVAGTLAAARLRKPKKAKIPKPTVPTANDARSLKDAPGIDFVKRGVRLAGQGEKVAREAVKTGKRILPKLAKKGKTAAKAGKSLGKGILGKIGSRAIPRAAKFLRGRGGLAAATLAGGAYAYHKLTENEQEPTDNIGPLLGAAARYVGGLVTRQGIKEGAVLVGKHAGASLAADYAISKFKKPKKKKKPKVALGSVAPERLPKAGDSHLVGNSLEQQLELCANEWSDAARAASLESRRRNAMAKGRNVGHQPDYHEQKINEYNRKAMHAMTKGVIAGADPDEEQLYRSLAESHAKIQMDPKYHAREEFYHRQREFEETDLAAKGKGSKLSKVYHGATRGAAGATLGSTLGGLGGYAAGSLSGALLGKAIGGSSPRAIGGVVGGTLGSAGGPLGIAAGALAGQWAGKVAGSGLGKVITKATGKAAPTIFRGAARSITGFGQAMRHAASSGPVTKTLGAVINKAGQSGGKVTQKAMSSVGSRAGASLGGVIGGISGSISGAALGGAAGIKSGIERGERKASQEHLKRAASARAAADYHNMFLSGSDSD